MLTYKEIAVWTETFTLLANRVGCFNQILGCKYDHAPDNPLVLCYGSGLYHVMYGGCDVVTFGLYDLDELATAFTLVDAWQDCAWNLARDGRLSEV